MQSQGFLKIGSAALLSIFLVACSTSGADDETMDDSANTAPTTTNTTVSTAPTQRAPTAAELAETELESTASVFYFDFDQSELKPEARADLVKHANYLKTHPNARYRLEGHADERGTREYNLALGERRAQAVERYLIVQGVSSNQLETISYGEEMPAQAGSNESAWRLNRRVEIK